MKYYWYSGICYNDQAFDNINISVLLKAIATVT